MRLNRITHTGLRTWALTTATAGTLAAAGLGLAGAAAAASTASGNAQDTISSLQAQGYSVQLDGMADNPMSECTVTGVQPAVGFQRRCGGPSARPDQVHHRPRRHLVPDDH